jgi:hypothetical protein
MLTHATYAVQVAIDKEFAGLLTKLGKAVDKVLSLLDLLVLQYKY